MKLESYAITNVGKVRTNNEDNYYSNGKYKKDTAVNIDEAESCSETGNGLYAVCDGMGGEEFGEIASLIAVTALDSFSDDFSSKSDQYIKLANKKVCELSEKNGGKKSGTTFAGVSINDGKATAYNVGDSRIYLYRDNEVRQLSIDHTYVNQLVSMGVIEAGEASTHSSRHVLTQHFGVSGDEMLISPSVSETIALVEGDRLLLCSDGLTDMVSDSEICEIMSKGSSAKETATELVETALKNGGKDNVTVQIIDCHENDKPMHEEEDDEHTGPIENTRVWKVVALVIVAGLICVTAYLGLKQVISMFNH